MKYVKAALTIDIPAGSKKKISIDGKDILIANINSSFYAVDNTCPHMGGSLYDGVLDGNSIICPKHGSTFDLTTGKVITSGKILFIKVKVSDLKSYPTKIEGNDVLIGIDS